MILRQSDSEPCASPTAPPPPSTSSAPDAPLGHLARLEHHVEVQPEARRRDDPTTVEPRSNKKARLEVLATAELQHAASPRYCCALSEVHIGMQGALNCNALVTEKLLLLAGARGVILSVTRHVEVDLVEVSFDGTLGRVACTTLRPDDPKRGFGRRAVCPQKVCAYVGVCVRICACV